MDVTQAFSYLVIFFFFWDVQRSSLVVLKSYSLNCSDGCEQLFAKAPVPCLDLTDWHRIWCKLGVNLMSIECQYDVNCGPIHYKHLFVSGSSPLLGPHWLSHQGRLLWGSVLETIDNSSFLKLENKIVIDDAIYLLWNHLIDRCLWQLFSLDNICCCRDASVSRGSGEAGWSGKL